MTPNGAGGFVGRAISSSSEIKVTIQDSYCNAQILTKDCAYASAWIGLSRKNLTLEVTGSYFGGSLLYIDENGKESVKKDRLFLGTFFMDSNILNKGSVVKRNHCIVKRKGNGNQTYNYNSLELTNKKTHIDDPTWFNVDVTDSGTKFYQWKTSLIQSSYDLITELNGKSGYDIRTNKNNFQSDLPYFNTTPNSYELANISPIGAGDVITMHTLSTDKETVTGTYTCTVSDEDIRAAGTNFAGGVLVRFTKFKDKNGTTYTGDPDEIRSMYFTVDFAGSGVRAVPGDYSVIYELVTHSSELGYRSSVKKSVNFRLVDEYDIELSAGTAENGTISFYNNENIARSVGSGVMTFISPKEGYQVKEAWITDDNKPASTKTPLDEKYNFSKQGFSFAWKTRGKYTVHATFEKKVYSVVFEGEHCKKIGADTVSEGEDYTFSIKYDDGYSAVGKKPVTVNGEPVTLDTTSGKYTVKNNHDAVRIKVTAKTKTDTALSVKSDVTSLTYGESVTLTATLKEGGTALSNKTVKFYDGTTLAGCGKTYENGNAAYTLARPTASTHTFKAVFSGDNDYNESTAATEDVTVLKKMLTVSVEPVVIDQGDPLSTLTVKVSDGFVSGENSGMLTGFALPNASADCTVDTLNTALKSFTVTFAGGNPTGNYRFDLSQTTVSITITPVPADYSSVDAAIAMIPEDLSVYTEETVNALNDAKNAVVRDKNITEQTTVDGYATAIEKVLRLQSFTNSFMRSMLKAQLRMNGLWN